MARRGYTVTYYLSAEGVEFIDAQALKLGISKSKAMQMSVELWKSSEDYLLESFGKEVPTTVELLSRMIVSEKEANAKQASRNERDANRLELIARAVASNMDSTEKATSHAQA